MYVCLCNALSDADIRQAASLLGASRPAEVFRACNCKVQCGTCSRAMRDMLKEESGRPRPPLLQAAE